MRYAAYSSRTKILSNGYWINVKARGRRWIVKISNGIRFCIRRDENDIDDDKVIKFTIDRFNLYK